jgi:hypothetical protein
MQDHLGGARPRNLWQAWRQRNWFRTRFVISQLQASGSSLSSYELWEDSRQLSWPLRMSLGSLYVLLLEMERLEYITIYYVGERMFCRMRGTANASPTSHNPTPEAKQ